MHEFNNRIAAQRHILKIVNASARGPEQLLSLSQKALERWVTANGIQPDTEIIRLLRLASAKLLFLANKSQEQVAEEYRSDWAELQRISGLIEGECRTATTNPETMPAS